MIISTNVLRRQQRPKELSQVTEQVRSRQNQDPAQSHVFNHWTMLPHVNLQHGKGSSSKKKKKEVLLDPIPADLCKLVPLSGHSVLTSILLVTLDHQQYPKHHNMLPCLTHVPLLAMFLLISFIRLTTLLILQNSAKTPAGECSPGQGSSGFSAPQCLVNECGLLPTLYRKQMSVSRCQRGKILKCIQFLIHTDHC